MATKRTTTRRRSRRPATTGRTRKRAAGRARAAPARKRAPARRATARPRRKTGARRSRTTGGARRTATERYARSTQRAKFVNSAEEHADRPGQTLATRDHEVIRRWAQERGAEPAAATRRDGRLGVLRFNFPRGTGRRLETVSWEEWFRTFDERQLVFLFQEQLRSGRQSNFFRFDSPEREDA